jgi:hypothetical protein
MKYLHKSRAVFFVDSNLFGLDVVVVVVAVLLQGVFFPHIFFFSIKKKSKKFFNKEKNKMGRTCIPKGQSNNNRRG